MSDSKNDNEMTMENKTIICIQCEREFEFTVNDQLRYKKMRIAEKTR